MIRKELEIARGIQMAILPKSMARIGDLVVAARYEPMEAIGGDFYDFLAVDDMRIGIIVADVCGHGIPAALSASMIKVAFAAQSGHASRAAKVVEELNRMLCATMHGQFATAGYLFVDAERRILSYCGAGHPPLLMWQS